MSDLRSTLQDVAEQFVSSILGAVRAASLAELAEEPSRSGAGGAPARRGPGRPPKAAAALPAAARQPAGRGGRRKRASSEEIQRQKDTVVAAAKQLSPGFSKGDVMRKSRSKVDLGRALSLLVAEGRLTKKGDRRLTRYWVK